MAAKQNRNRREMMIGFIYVIRKGTTQKKIKRRLARLTVEALVDPEDLRVSFYTGGHKPIAMGTVCNDESIVVGIGERVTEEQAVVALRKLARMINGGEPVGRLHRAGSESADAVEEAVLEKRITL